MEQSRILEYISRPDMKYTTEIFGLERFISFMADKGYLSSGISAEEVLYK